MLLVGAPSLEANVNCGISNSRAYALSRKATIFIDNMMYGS